MSGGRFVITSETKVNITLVLLVAVLVSLLGAAWQMGGWKREIDLSIQMLKEQKCPCRDFYRTVPPDVQR